MLNSNKKISLLKVFVFHVLVLNGFVVNATIDSPNVNDNQQISGTKIVNSTYHHIKKELAEIERFFKIEPEVTAQKKKISHTKKKETLHRLRNMMHKLRTVTDEEGAALLKKLEILEHKVSSMHSQHRRNMYPPKNKT